MEGTIVKVQSGLYQVLCENERIDCRPRGKLRLEDQTILTGDYVTFSRQGRTGTLLEVLPRKNSFIRPAVANLDQLVVFASQAIPQTDPYLIDRVAAIAQNQGVPVVLVINKWDLEPGDELERIYRHAGFSVIAASAVTGQGVDALRGAIAGRVSAFTGNSGVGKSSLLNCLDPAFAIQTQAVSEKLGRGKHTTRHVELYPLPGGAWVADTPGFASFDTNRMDLVVKENLQYAFPDFAPYLGACRFHDCAHLAEPDCAVRAALAAGEIEQTRYDSYVRLYRHASERNAWEL